jgi:hypothetical protein
VNKLIALWDAGKPIVSVEMGDMGRRYELHIQSAAVELARRGVIGFKPCGDMETEYDSWALFCKRVKLPERLRGLSGAQHGAATWLAWQWCCGGGPHRLVLRYRRERPGDVILVRRRGICAESQSI